MITHLVGAWVAGDGVRVTRGKRLIPYPRCYDTKNKHVSHGESRAVPGLLLAAPLPGMSVSAALQQLMHCAASEASESPGPGCRMGLHGREHRGATEESPVPTAGISGTSAPAANSSSGCRAMRQRFGLIPNLHQQQ